MVDSQDITLVIGAYNRGSQIAATLDSVFVQTSQAAEIIVVDDGSTDNTAAFVRERYPDVRVETKQNGGTSSARNYGADLARSEVLMFLDHDDLLHPHAVETLASLLTKHQEAAAAYCDHEYHNLETGLIHRNHHYMIPAFRRLLRTAVIRSDATDRLFGRPLYRSLLWGNLLQQPWAIRKAAFQAVGGFNEAIRYCEDWDMYLRVTRNCPVVVSDQVISKHIIEGENLHLTAAIKQEAMYERVLQDCWAKRSRWAWRENRILRKKLASQRKTWGDRAKAAGDHRTAWRRYLQAAAWWPCDHVVASRTLLWAGAALLGRTPPSPSVEADRVR